MIEPNHQSRRPFCAAFAIIFAVSALACRGDSAEASSHSVAAKAESGKDAGQSCDQTLWTHVYDPARLTIMKRCISASGLVEESNVDEDGDQHLLLKLDQGQDQLLVKKNLKKKNGDLVVEIVCANKVKIKKAKAACAGYSNSIPLPAVGSHIRVTGSYVIDGHNGWAEVHPVTGWQSI